LQVLHESLAHFEVVVTNAALAMLCTMAVSMCGEVWRAPPAFGLRPPELAPNSNIMPVLK
jgi:hypothetical protein